jgi:2-polyprenyl-3-methyl-5-hydroxy-6-metoxy-1,4-benzoquinol methylase
VTSPDPAQYDAFAEAYEAHATAAPYNALYDRPAMLELIGDVHGLRVLDAACGPGLYAEELVRRGADVVGCDGSAQMIELARRRVGPQVDLRVHELGQPFTWLETGSVDMVVCALALHYVNDRVAFLRECVRVLRPDGVMALSTHHPTDDWARLGGSYFDVDAVTEVWSQGWTVTAWRMPLTQLTGEIAEAGFVVERLVEPRPVPEMAERHPEAYALLTTTPGFVMFRLRPSPWREDGLGASSST